MAGSSQTTMSEPRMTPADERKRNYLVIVYQFGKVASTSVVAALNEVEGFEALQSHFMGRKTLSAAVDRMVTPEVSDYFFEHQLGQFIENVRLTRRFLAVRAGQGDQRLAIISMSREPLEWFRSSVVQDIEGHLPRMKQFLDRVGASYSDDGAAVQLAMTRLMSLFARILENHGGVDAVCRALPQDSQTIFAGTALEKDDLSRQFFYLMMRPFNWFEKHFETTLSIRLSDMRRESGVFVHNDLTGDYFVFRYEDIKGALPFCLRELGVSEVPELQKKNVSEVKYMAAETRISLQSPAARRLREHFRESDYSKTFKYLYE